MEDYDAMQDKMSVNCFTNREWNVRLPGDSVRIVQEGDYRIAKRVTPGTLNAFSLSDQSLP
jgi:hypothetical protein